MFLLGPADLDQGSNSRINIHGNLKPLSLKSDSSHNLQYWQFIAFVSSDLASYGL